MSDSFIIGYIGETLKKLLEMDEWWEDFSQKPTISLQSPKELQPESNNPPTNTVSVFLFQIHENAHLKNQEMQKSNSIHLRPSPLTLDLQYLVTPYDNDKTQEKYILGRVMQIFYDNAFLKGSILHENIPPEEEFRLSLIPLAMTDLIEIWKAFEGISYRLSVVYRVTPIEIDSTREIEARRIVERDLGFYKARITQE